MRKMKKISGNLLFIKRLFIKMMQSLEELKRIMMNIMEGME